VTPQAHAPLHHSGHPAVDHLFRTGERIMMGGQAHGICSGTGPDVLLDPVSTAALFAD